MCKIRVDDNGTWRKVVLDRPDRLNSLTREMREALLAALADAADESACRAVLLTGEGRGFCAGQDLSEVVKSEGFDFGQTLEREYNALIRVIRGMPKPVICAVNGVAAGAGANLALACDIVLAGRSAKFIQAFAAIGLVPDSGGSFFLPRLVGEARARALALTAEPVTADVAADWGMIWKAVDDAALMAEATRLTEHLASQATVGLALAKSAFNASATNSLDAQLDLERDLQIQAGRSPDHAEGVAAFIEKRPPRFTGRAD